MNKLEYCHAYVKMVRAKQKLDKLIRKHRKWVDGKTEIELLKEKITQLTNEVQELKILVGRLRSKG